MGAQRSALHAAFGSRVREARLRRGLSQDQLAAHSGLHRAYIGGVERGERNPSLSSIARLAEALEVQVGDLVAEIQDSA